MNFLARKSLKKHSDLPALLDNRVSPWGSYSQSLLRRIEQTDGSPIRTIGITGCRPKAGASTIAANLAIASAQQGNHATLLIDANLQSPSLDELFALRKSAGIADLLSNDDLPLDYVQPITTSRLSVLAAGRVGLLGASHFSAVRFLQILENLKANFSRIVVDLPVANENTCCFSIAGLLDGIVLVLESEKVPAKMAQYACGELTKSRARILGAVLNRRRAYLPKWLVGA